MNLIALCFVATLVDVVSGRVLGKWGSRGRHAGALLDVPKDSSLAWLSDVGAPLDVPKDSSLAWLSDVDQEHHEQTELVKRMEADWADCKSQRVDTGNFIVHDSLPTEADLKSYQRLFAKFHGKTVVFAGDSLMREIWGTFGCAASLLNATVKTSLYQRLIESSNGVKREPKSGPYDSILEKSGAGTTSAAHSKMKISFPDGTHFQMDFILFYLAFDNVENTTGYGGPLVISNSVLVNEVKKYDHVYVNIGHAPFQDDWPCTDIAGKLVDAIAAKNIDATFVDHPPAHFATPHGDYDKDKGFTGCGCQSLKQLKKQDSYECERVWMEPYLRSKGIAMATFFESLADHCDSHFPEKSDCRHYHFHPTLHKHLASEMELHFK